MTTTAASPLETWPSLPLEAWSETCATLHLWTQIVGKIRLAQRPWINHSWHVDAVRHARGPDHVADPVRRPDVPDRLRLHRPPAARSQPATGGTAALPLEPQSVADFYARLMAELARTRHLHVNDLPTTPNEVADPIRFDQDESTPAYDAEYANRFWRVLVAGRPGASSSFAPGSSASAAPCTSSGAASTWP